MYINICNKLFDVQDIQNVIIKDKEILLETNDDFHRLKYNTQEEIMELNNWIKFNNLTKEDLLQALHLIIITCEFFINTKEQCKICPLKKKDGCVFTSIPLDWKA